MMSDYKVEMVNDGMQEFFVEFKGPTESTNLLLQSSSSLLPIRLPVRDLDLVRESEYEGKLQSEYERKLQISPLDRLGNYYFI
jgi:hypothetical protein